MDEDMYPDPTRFKPHRYFKDGLWNPDIRDPALAAFGFGKRICPGRFLAKEFLWIVISSILARSEERSMRTVKKSSLKKLTVPACCREQNSNIPRSQLG